MLMTAVRIAQVPLEVLQTVVKVPMRVARQAAEQVAVEISPRPLPGHVERCHLIRLVDHVERDHHVGEGERRVPGAGDVTERRLADHPATDQRALAQRLDLAARVVDLRGQEQLDLVEAVGDRLQPAADDLLLGDPVGRIDRADLPRRPLNIRRQFGQARPVEISSGNPAVANRILVEVADTFGPDLGTVEDRVAPGHVQARHRSRPARRVILQVPHLRHIAVGADIDITEPHPIGRRRGLESPFAGRLEHHEPRASGHRMIGIGFDPIEPLADPLRFDRDVQQRFDLRRRRNRRFDPSDQLVRPTTRTRAHLDCLAELHAPPPCCD